jgi:hypothetical protein
MVTSVCAILGAVCGYLGWRSYLTLRSRLVLVALLLVTIIGGKYVDWNARKPLVRDMYRVRIGMTAAEADLVMSRHKIGPGENPREEPPIGDGELVYGTRRTSDQVIFEIRDGRIAHVEFGHD